MKKYNEILVKIESMMPYLSKTEYKVAHYFVGNAQNVITMSTKELSKECCVSEPTLIRFTKKLGFSGIKDFKLKLSASLGTNPVDSYLAGVEKNDKPIDIYRKLSSYIITSINSTIETLDKNELEKAVELIYNTHINKNVIFLSGMGASGIPVRNLQIKLMRLGIYASFYEDIHVRLEACTNLKEGDLVIVITTLGSAIENYQIIDIAKQKGANVVVITQYGNEKIAEKVDAVLYTSVMENDTRLVSHAAIAVQNLIIDTIFFSLAYKNFDEIKDSVHEIKKIINEFGHFAKIDKDYIK